MAIPNYVKFQRGTLTAYNRLSVKDENTLYFIYDAVDETKGTLYLGSRLIGSVGGQGGVNNLSELSDVLISAANTGDFLVLNSEGKWTSISAANVAQTILEAGGNFVDIDEQQFNFNSVNGKLELKGYATADVNTIPVKGVNGLSWQAMPSTTEISTKVTNLETAMTQAQTDITNLQTAVSGVDGKINDAIVAANHLKYQVITDLTDANEENIIYLYKDNNSTSLNDQYNEYILVNGVLEFLGHTTDIDLSNYATINDLSSKADAADVLNLSTKVNTLETNVVNLTTTVDNLADKISTFENNDYVLTSTFNTTVGNLSAVNGVLNNLNANASIADTLVDIYDKLTWQEISE